MATVGTISKDEDGMEQEELRRADDNAFKDMGDIENEDFIYVFWSTLFLFSFLVEVLVSSGWCSRRNPDSENKECTPL